MSADGYLHRHFLANGGRRLHKWMHYFDIYERHFERFRGRAPLVLEIGVSGGGSLEMWRGYFGPGSRIVGLDVDPACAAHAGDGVDVVIGDQGDPAVLADILARFGAPDIVIDDGSHRMADVLASFRHLYPAVSATGVYLVEDTHTSYWEEYGGGLRREGSFIEHAKALVDELNAAHARGALAPTGFTRTTDSITFYDSVVVFERRPQSVRQAPVTKGMTEGAPGAATPSGRGA